MLGRVDKWLAREFAPHRMSETLRALAGARPGSPPAATDYDTTSKVADRGRKLAQYRAALDAGANPATVAPWIAETEAEKASYTLVTSNRRNSARRVIAAESRLTFDTAETAAPLPPPAVRIPTRTWKEIERSTRSNVGCGPRRKAGCET